MDNSRENWADKLKQVWGSCKTYELDELLESSYLQDAVDFLYSTNTEISISLIGKLSPPWGALTQDPVNTYEVILKNNKYTYTFKYYSSHIATYGPRAYRNESMYKYEKRKKVAENSMRKRLKIYDVLACLSVYGASTFEDFCLEFDLSTDSREALNTYLRVQEQESALQKLWPSHLEDLNNIW